MSIPDHAEAPLFLSYEPYAATPIAPAPHPDSGSVDLTWSHAGTTLPP